MCIIPYSKSNSRKEISEAGKSSKHQGGHRTRGGRVPGTKVVDANFVRSRQRRKRDVNSRHSIGGVGGETSITVGSDGGAGENIDKLRVPTVARLGDIPRSGTAGTNVGEQGQHRRFRNRESGLRCKWERHLYSTAVST